MEKVNFTGSCISITTAVSSLSASAVCASLTLAAKDIFHVFQIFSELSKRGQLIFMDFMNYFIGLLPVPVSPDALNFTPSLEQAMVMDSPN